MKPVSTEDYLKALFLDSKIVELRHIDGRKITSGIYSDLQPLLRDARSLSGSGNLFTSLNAPKPIKAKNALSIQALRDDDIEFITRLPMDFDPLRPTGVSSTSDEMAASRGLRERFVIVMNNRGWGVPLLAKSGNGYHCQYRCRLPANAETREALTAIYRGLATEFATDEAVFDPTVRNPSRIFTLYGSLKRKGQNTKDRPHRKSVCWIPPEWRQVPRDLVMQMADMYARKNARPEPTPHKSSGKIEGNGDYGTLDVVRWLQCAGLYKRPSHDSGKHYVICPWVSEHSSPDHPQKTDTVIWEADGGWPTFHCSHAHCDGRGVRDVMATLGNADAFCSQSWGSEAG